MKLQTTSGTNRAERELSLVERTSIEIFRRVLFLRLGAQPDHAGQTAPTVATNASCWHSHLAKEEAETERNHRHNAGCRNPTARSAEVAKMFSTYKSTYIRRSPESRRGAIHRQAVGHQPNAEVQCPAILRLQRVGATRIEAAEEGCVHKLRIERGDGSKREAPGQDSIFSWERSYWTFKSAMLLLC